MSEKNKLIVGLMLLAIAISLIVATNRSSSICQKNIEIATFFMNIQGVDTKYISGIDCHKNVGIYVVKKGDKLIQYQVPGRPQGNFYGFEGSTPSSLGISETGYDPVTKTIMEKEKRVYMAKKNFKVLLSFSAPVKDDWSTPEIETQTEGTAPQILTTCKECFE